MISTDQAEGWLHYLIDSAPKAAAARANRLVMEDFGKVVKSEIMCQYPELPVSAQEREAYRHPKYKAHLAALKVAIAEDEEYRFRRDAADAGLRAYQTQEATLRAQRI